MEDSSFAGLYAGCHNDGALKGKTRTQLSFICIDPRRDHGFDLPLYPTLQRQGVAVDAAMRITIQRSGANTVNPRKPSAEPAPTRARKVLMMTSLQFL
jgi:hypothetical protein